MKPRLLFLFPEGWDDIARASVPALRDEFGTVTEGFDLFRFPQNARLLWFDAPGWVDRLTQRFRRRGLAGVLSTHEQYGALIAALLAQRLGLPGTDPAAIVRAQHKYHARELLAAAVPDANPRFRLLPYTFDATHVAGSEPGFPYPFFVKPVKAAFSVLARRVDSAAELQRHLTFHPWERHVIKRLVRPFGALMRCVPGITVDPAHMLAEGLIDGVQINVDGWVDRGKAEVFGVVDSVMYPGTQAFLRFDYPSRIPPAAQDAACEVALRAIRAVGFDHGAFNVELCWDPATNRLQIVEVNPRFAAQFGDLYEKVDGDSPYRVLADLAVGRTPAWRRRRGRHSVASSFVFREFDGAVKVAPERAAIRWLTERYPDAHLQTFIKRGNARAREMKWLGSYRYAIVNLGGRDVADLEHRHRDVCDHVSFNPAPPRVRVGGSIDAVRPHR